VQERRCRRQSRKLEIVRVWAADGRERDYRIVRGQNSVDREGQRCALYDVFPGFVAVGSEVRLSVRDRRLDDDFCRARDESAVRRYWGTCPTTPQDWTEVSACSVTASR